MSALWSANFAVWIIQLALNISARNGNKNTISRHILPVITIMIIWYSSANRSGSPRRLTMYRTTRISNIVFRRNHLSIHISTKPRTKEHDAKSWDSWWAPGWMTGKKATGLTLHYDINNGLEESIPHQPLKNLGRRTFTFNVNLTILIRGSN